MVFSTFQGEWFMSGFSESNSKLSFVEYIKRISFVALSSEMVVTSILIYIVKISISDIRESLKRI